MTEHLVCKVSQLKIGGVGQLLFSRACYYSFCPTLVDFLLMLYTSKTSQQAPILRLPFE